MFIPGKLWGLVYDWEQGLRAFNEAQDLKNLQEAMSLAYPVTVSDEEKSL